MVTYVVRNTVCVGHQYTRRGETLMWLVEGQVLRKETTVGLEQLLAGGDR